MSYYRLFLQPHYGERAPEVVVPEEEKLDLSNPTISRAKLLPEIFSVMVSQVRQTSCYNDIMKIAVTNLRIRVADGEEIPVRIYHPEGDGIHSVLYFIHGGGFISNDLSIYDYVNRYLCKFSNAVVVAPEYRLAPEYKCPIGREDCYQVLEWVEENIAKYGGNVSRVSVCGDSAGGNLAAAMALMSRDRKGPKIIKQMMVFPLTTFVLDETTYSEERYGKGDYFIKVDSKNNSLCEVYFTDPKEANEPYNSPLLSNDLNDLPEAYFYAAECDPLLDQGLMYAAKLQDAGVKVEYYIYEGMIHGFLNRTYQKTYECLNQICKDINK